MCWIASRTTIRFDSLSLISDDTAEIQLESMEDDSLSLLAIVELERAWLFEDAFVAEQRILVETAVRVCFFFFFFFFFFFLLFVFFTTAATVATTAAAASAS